MFLPQCDRTSCAPVLNNRQNYFSLCLILYIFR
jgi:hypothetical protein